MAVVRMKKAYIIAHNAIRQEVIDALHEQGLLHVSDFRERVKESELVKELSEFKPQLNEVNLLIGRVEFVLDFFQRFEAKKSFFENMKKSMLKEKVKIAKAEFRIAEKRINFEDVYSRCGRIDARFAEISNRLASLQILKKNLEPWIPLKLKLSDIAETKFEKLMLMGSIASDALQDLELELKDGILESSVDVVNQHAQTFYILVSSLKNKEEQIRDLLSRYEFKPILFPGLTETPEAEIARAGEESAELKKEEENLLGQVKDLSFLKPDAMVLRDYLENKKRKIEIQVNFVETRETFTLEGWVAADCVGELESEVNRISDEIDLLVTEPPEGEKPPTVLKNRLLIQPFEVLTRLYGLPDYNEPDPTPLMAPFFFVFFGLCLGDFGYGLVLALACWLAARSWKEKYGISENAERFLMLFAYGGVASMIMGILTGGYFGIEMRSLPLILKKMVVIDPLNQASLFLVITWVLGIVQITYGISIEIYDSLRNRNYTEAIFVHVTTLVFLLSAVFWITCWLSHSLGGKPSPLIETLYPISTLILATAALLVIFLQGSWLKYFGEQFLEILRSFGKKRFSEIVRQSLGIIYGTIFAVVVAGWVAGLVGFKSVPISIVGLIFLVGLFTGITRPIIVKFLGGLYNLYGMFSFMGDILSYSRLMALGLATVLIGLVVNMLAKMIFVAIWPKALSFGSLLVLVIGFICIVGILLVGHGFNLIINLLGAFVHPLRLQYVEFFPKFYEDGGEKFKAFAPKTKYLFFKEE